MHQQRPILISVVQYAEPLAAGTMTIADFVRKAQALGADGVELRREAWPAYQSEVTAVRAQIQEAGLLVTYATFSTLFNSDPAAHEQLLDDITTARELGSPLLRVFPGATPADDGADGWVQAQQALDHAAGSGVQLALENFARTPGGTLAEIVNILQRFETPTLKTNIDIGNYPLHGQDVVAAIHAIGTRAIYVHVKDYGGTPEAPAPIFGQGVLPLEEIFAALNELPQQLVLCLEFGGGDNPDQHITDALTLLRGHDRGSSRESHQENSEANTGANTGENVGA